MGTYTLVIVESPTKAKKIAGFLGGAFRVRASFGHIRDLPKGGDLAVRFEAGAVRPQYQITAEASTIAALRDEAARADRVVLASDPDREGEAISWHLREVLGGGFRYERVAFHAITPDAIAAAMAAPRAIDQGLVDAQQARRVLDRVVGWVVSPTCRSADPAARSAGRVQSVALRLVVERELEIQAFRPQEYYVVAAKLERPGTAPPFVATLVRWEQSDLASGFASPGQAETAIEACRQGRWTVVKAATAPSQRNAPPPFTTATVQQACSVQLGLRPEQTTAVLQGLFEEGLITYPRTDSVAISPEGVAMARAHIASAFGGDALPATAPTYSSRSANTQEAHEAIRPTSLEGGPQAVGGGAQGDVYRLIWNRFVASQMKPGVDAVTVVEISAAGDRALFRARGVVRLADGWRAVSEDATDEASAAKRRREAGDVDEDTDPDEDDGVQLPRLLVGEALRSLGMRQSRRLTKAPARFTQASLIKRLDHDGIGRPSTYATIMRTLLERAYVVDKRRKLEATPTGVKLIEFAKRAYAGNFIEYAFTRNMEEQLDRIARGECAWQPLVHEASHSVLTLARAAGLAYNPLAGEAQDRNLPERCEIPRGTRESICRTCAAAIYWITLDGRSVPCNADGTPHQKTCVRSGGGRAQRGARRPKVGPSRGGPEHPQKPAAMRPCRDCSQQIGFGSSQGRTVVLNPDGSPHRCRTSGV